MVTSQDFSTMLDELLAEEAAGQPMPTPLGAVDYLSAIEELHSGRIVIADDVTASYRALEEAVEATPVSTQPAPLPSLDPEDIAIELGVGEERDLHEIDAKRRRFAFANHPDRVAPALRERALQRMQIANMLADVAKSSASKPIQRRK